MLLYPGMSPAAMDESGLSTVLASAADATKSCAELGCVRKQGWFMCEFYPRHGSDDVGKRTAVTTGRASYSVQQWKLQCSGERQCGWRINYSYSKKNGTYSLTEKVLQHTGHTLHISSSVRLQTCADVPSEMWTDLCRWVTCNLGGQQLRDVSILSHIYLSPLAVFTQFFASLHTVSHNVLVIPYINYH